MEYLAHMIQLTFLGGPLDGLRLDSHIPPKQNFISSVGAAKYHGHWKALGQYEYLYTGDIKDYVE